MTNTIKFGNEKAFTHNTKEENSNYEISDINPFSMVFFFLPLNFIGSGILTYTLLWREDQSLEHIFPLTFATLFFVFLSSVVIFCKFTLISYLLSYKIFRPKFTFSKTVKNRYIKKI